MSFDLLIKNAKVFNDTESAIVQDIGIKDGMVVARASGLDASDATKVIDADGYWAMPGLFDIHTHYDLEVELSPGLPESVRHGTTTVVVSNCEAHQKLITYLSDYKINKLGLVVGVRELLRIVDDKYKAFQNGRLLAAFGELFTRNVKMYVYPAMQEGSEELMTASNLPVPEGIKFLYQHLLDAHQKTDTS